VGDDLRVTGWQGGGTTTQQAGDNQAKANKSAAHAGYYTPRTASLVAFILKFIEKQPFEACGHEACRTLQKAKSS
jgi:hypothetical protein